MARRKNIKPKSKAQKPTIDDDSMPKLPKPVLEFLYKQHRQLDRAIGIVSLARFASDSLITGKPSMALGLEAAENILFEVTEAIEDVVPLSFLHDKQDEADETIGQGGDA